ncbi:hypothetical protein HII31_01578 [Pseudocercospora fuligena]|uniref:Uncharacterized protein n=1 Tax=Pseudocercospora fuligena TaxID=685502 RepID=A0A8H6RUI6_9PEZI|nr:hypothetical protein HII31_01578 [Pseudocercospora fuligena]
MALMTFIVLTLAVMIIAVVKYVEASRQDKRSATRKLPGPKVDQVFLSSAMFINYQRSAAGSNFTIGPSSTVRSIKSTSRAQIT